MKSKKAVKRWLWWYRLITKFTWIVVITFFAINLHIPLNPFFATPFCFHSFFHTCYFEQGCTFFTARLFLSRYHFFVSRHTVMCRGPKKPWVRANGSEYINRNNKVAIFMHSVIFDLNITKFSMEVPVYKERLHS